ncbi:MAG: glutamate 5-kinase [Cellvibrionales bacterium]|nr:glutamate 5-kinase [Cellvibrionales bacterium]
MRKDSKTSKDTATSAKTPTHLRSGLKHPGTWVVKLGSALLTRAGLDLECAAIADWVAQLAALHARGYQIVLVSSGAVAAGLARLGWKTRPTAIDQLQAAAAVGQMRLVQAYEQAFQKFHLTTAQILLTAADLSDRTGYLNARSTIRTLLAAGSIPIINENDSVATDEIRFGDNDRLAGLVANLVQADWLLILTDQNGLHTADPRHTPDAKLIPQAAASDEKLAQMAAPSAGTLGRGGMQTKLAAARLAARSGTHSILCNGRTPHILERLAQAENLGTLLYADNAPLAARKRWLAGQLRVAGTLHLDAGAAQALGAGRSLLPIGVTAVAGTFTRGDLVSLRTAAGTELARGLVNYSAAESRQIIGRRSPQITQILGYSNADALVHRDNLVLLN